jgi:hypothetical protein
MVHRGHIRSTGTTATVRYNTCLAPRKETDELFRGRHYEFGLARADGGGGWRG